MATRVKSNAGLSKVVNELARIKRMEQEVARQKKELSARAKEYMHLFVDSDGKYEYVTGDKNVAKYIEYTENRLDSSMVQELDPELFARCCKERKITRLTIN